MGGEGVTARLFQMDDVLDSDHWYTPPWIFDGLAITFDLDVAAPADALSWIPAQRFYTIADDGLALPWTGTVWCNPPYSAPTAWCYKWARHGDGCILLRADLSTRGPFAAMSAATSIYVPPKRLQFVNGHGGTTGAVNFSTVLLGLGPIADAGIARLASRYGGSGRKLTTTAKGNMT
jgi:phage N-6-adenine-methyltransferase